MQKEFIKKARKTFVLQKDQSDCGVACLLSLIRFYGGENSLEELRKQSGTSVQGTTMLGLYQAANQSGLNAEGNEADIPAIIEHGKPLILHCLIDEKLEHYIVCFGYSETQGFLIGDPAKGVDFISQDELEKIWQSKICLTVEPAEKFVQETALKKSKKEWFWNLLKEDKKFLLFSILLGVGFAVLNMAMAVFSQKLIDDILPSKKMDKLIGGIILLSLLLVIRTGFSGMRSYILALQSRDFNNRIIHYFYSHLLYLPKPFFDTRKIGELTARLNDTSRIQRVIQYIINNFVIDFLMVLVSLGFLFYYSWKIGFIAALSLPIYFLMIFKFNKKIIQSQKEVMQNYALSESNYISTMHGIAEIKNFNRQSFFQTLNQSIYSKFQDKILNLGILNIRISLYSGLVGVLFMACVLSVTSVMVLKNLMNLGELMAILGIAGSLLPSTANLALVSIPINEAKIAFDRMFEFTSMEMEKDGKTKLLTFEKLEIRNLDFRFPGRSKLFENLNLKIEKGKITAFVGESGSGKSTLGQILQKFYTPESGNIIINQQIPLENITNKNWRKLVGVIPQEIRLFNGNILDNMLLGEKPNSQKIENFINSFGFNQFLTSLPQGLATIVGEEGVNLSGGQKQILALMRVLYYSPHLLILDEPTSAMDRNTEKFTLDLLKRLKPKTAIFLITHRLDSLSGLADEIYVLENKTVTFSGNHSKLLKQSNFYSDYFKV